MEKNRYHSLFHHLKPRLELSDNWITIPKGQLASCAICCKAVSHSGSGLAAWLEALGAVCWSSCKKGGKKISTESWRYQNKSEYIYNIIIMEILSSLYHMCIQIKPSSCYPFFLVWETSTLFFQAIRTLTHKCPISSINTTTPRHAKVPAMPHGGKASDTRGKSWTWAAERKVSGRSVCKSTSGGRPMHHCDHPMGF